MRTTIKRRHPGKAKTSIRDLPMIGMWKDREDMKDPAEWVREVRKPRFQP